MSRPAVLGLTLVVGALALLVLWLTPVGRVGGERTEPESVPQENVDPSGPPSLLHAEGPGGAQTVLPDAASDIDGDRTRAAQRATSPDERPRISGAVRVPPGLPADEVVKVWAEVFPKSGNGGPQKLATLVAKDGRFSFVVPENTEYAKLDLECRFLVLHKVVKARPGELGVVLRPMVYASIEGLVVPPQSLSTLGASWADMGVSWSFDLRPDLRPQDMESTMQSPSRDKPVEPDRHGVFALSFVPVGVELDLRAENPFGPRWVQRIEPLAPAERRRITITLELGATISGRVIDEHGLPVKGVHILADEHGLTHRSLGRGSIDPPKTDAGGRFVLARMFRRALRISTRGKDLAREAEATVDGAAGDVDDLLLTVVRGGCLEGTVVWANGTPVDGFEIRAWGSEGHESKYVEGSRFSLCGLYDGSYFVNVRAERSGVIGTADAADAQPGAPSIELVLREVQGFDLRGVVVDELDRRIAHASIRATLAGPQRRSEPADEPPDGSFVFRGLEAGEWTVEAKATGHQSSSQKVVVGGSSSDPLRIVLAQAGRIRGRVVDPAGAPVTGAWVGEESRASFAKLVGRTDNCTDAEGRFEFEADSTSLRLLAQKIGFSPSSVVELDVGPGESVEGIVLGLHKICRVKGRVLDERGAPLQGAHVSMSSPDLGLGGVETDARGAFELDGLPPGPVRLFASDPARPESIASADVLLAPGESSSVELRFEEPDPVRVHGRITRDGRPLEFQLALRSRSFAARGGSGPDGRFEFTLPGPGDWVGVVWRTGDESSWPGPLQGDVRRFAVSIPDVDEHAFELEFDALPRLISMEQLQLPR